MNPERFPESNTTLSAPPGMEKNVEPLAIWTDGERCISCWRMTWRERFSALIFGRVWIQVMSGRTQPPIGADAARTLFTKR